MPISSPTFKPVGMSVTVEVSTQGKITNKALVGGVESGHVLETSLKMLSVKCREYDTVRFSFASGETSTNYVTIWKGTVWSIPDINFTGKSIYFLCANNCTLEIQEYF